MPGAEAEAAAFSFHRPEGEGPFPLVVVLHGFKGFRNWGFFPHLAECLAAEGLAALRLDFSHNGVGQGERSRDFDRLDLFRRNRARFEREDVSALLTALREDRLDPFPDIRAQVRTDRLGFFGHSRGGPIAILSAAEESAPVVTWNSVASLAFREEQVEAFRRDGLLRVPNARTGQIMEIGPEVFDEMEPLPEQWRLEPALETLAARLLLVHGTEDPAVPFSAAESLHARSRGQAGLHPVAGGDHVFGARHPFAGRTPQLDEAIEVTIAHFRRTFAED